MKKIYIAPSVLSTNVELSRICVTSVAKQTEGGDGTQLKKEEYQWDIWGKMQEEEEDEAYYEDEYAEYPY